MGEVGGTRCSPDDEIPYVVAGVLLLDSLPAQRRRLGKIELWVGRRVAGRGTGGSSRGGITIGPESAPEGTMATGPYAVVQSCGCCWPEGGS